MGRRDIDVQCAGREYVDVQCLICSTDMVCGVQCFLYVAPKYNFVAETQVEEQWLGGYNLDMQCAGIAYVVQCLT